METKKEFVSPYANREKYTADWCRETQTLTFCTYDVEHKRKSCGTIPMNDTEFMNQPIGKSCYDFDAFVENNENKIVWDNSYPITNL